MNEYLVDLYDEVLAYRRDLESILHNVPDFPNKFECEDFIKGAISELDYWLKKREKDYRQLIAKMEVFDTSHVPKKRVLKLTMVFKEGTEKENTFGSDQIGYEIYYYYENGIMEVLEIGSFGDRTLLGSFNDRRGRGITEDEMLENIKEIANMNFGTFKKKILDKCK